MIPPSFRYLLTVATHRHPRYLLRLLNSFDEIYALLLLAVERHFLKTYGGSFTENFYGLKREQVLQIKGGDAPRTQAGAPDLLRDTTRLRNVDIWRNLFLLVGIPYIKRKLDESFEIHGSAQTAVIRVGPNYRRDELPANPSIRQRIFWHYKWFLRKVYPSLNAVHHLSLLAFSLAYLFDNSSYSSPLLWLIGIRIRRLSEADYRASAITDQAPTALSKPDASVAQKSKSWWATLTSRAVPSAALSRLLSGLQIILPTSIFALKFLEWWYASDFAHQLSKKAIEGIDLPPPVLSGNIQESQPRQNDSAEQAGINREKVNPEQSVYQPARTPNSVSLSNKPSVPRSGEGNLQTSVPHSSDASSKDLIHSNRGDHPTSISSQLPIYTVQAPNSLTSGLCPICRHPIQTPTSAQTGYLFCYTCIFKWVDGSHERQTAFMEGQILSSEWDEDDRDSQAKKTEIPTESLIGKWEDGKGRCAVTGRRVLGGTAGLRRIMV